ncbi:zinc finger protein 425-like [Macrosteles quadrilineatus]|uniref:zinc finger protein 425-like n=1 Tax=Macrosteles quadrilineatus TaxID=74068 RepID=UPI0023E19293|nr:zinc finger protein 425-like [Macrosteles quadrilineatus]
MTRHLRYECGAEWLFPCSFCTYKAKQKAHLMSHIALRHSSTCDVCGKSYKYRRSMLRHKRYECQRTAGQFPCPFCPYHTKWKSNLQSHMLFKHLTTLLYPKSFRVLSVEDRTTAKTIFFVTRNLSAVKIPTISYTSFKVTDKFSCEKCGRSYNRKDNLQRHQKLECGQDPGFFCPVCPYKTKHKMIGYTSFKIKDKFSCEKCGRSYNRKDNLQRHQKLECGQDPGFFCPVCPYKTKHKNSGYEVVLKDGKERFVCVSCGRSYSRKPNLRQHQRYECNTEPNYLGTSGGMEVHGALEIFRRSEEVNGARYVNFLGDGDSKAFDTVKEDKVYGDDVDFNKLECIGHVQKRMGKRLMNLKIKTAKTALPDGKGLGVIGYTSFKIKDKFSCEKCGRSYNRKDNLQRHQKLECGQDPGFFCPVCPYKTKHKNSGYEVVLKDGKERFVCVSCGRSYSRKPNLRQHQRYECNTEHYPPHPVGGPTAPWMASVSLLSSQKHPCFKCGRSYKRKDHLTRHLRWECGKTPQFQCCYKCQKCGKVYTLKTNLCRHVNLECGQPPKFACTLCPYKAKRKGTLKTHMPSHVPEVWTRVHAET